MELMSEERVRSVTTEEFNAMTSEEKINYWKSRIVILEVRIEISESERLGGSAVEGWNDTIKFLQNAIDTESKKLN